MAEQYLAQTQQQRMQLVLAPQLRQSLEMLQVPMMELRTLVQQEIQQNPTLEELAEEDRLPEVEAPAEAPDPQETENQELEFKEEFEVLSRLDDEWRDYFQQNHTSFGSSPEAESKRQYMMESITAPPSLQEHLLSQLHLLELSSDQQQIAELVIGNINDDGYLTSPSEDLAEANVFGLDEIEQALAVVQEFDPIGVGARDLNECLVMQLRRFGMEDSTAEQIIKHHLNQLGTKKYADIAKALKVDLEEVKQVAQFISTLEPKPGRIFSSDTTAYVIPEITVTKMRGEFVVLQNDEQLPHLRISKHYRKLMEDPTTPSEVISYIREKIRAGSFLIRSIEQRQRTISRIANEIVSIQQEFLEKGIAHLRPLTMAEVADKLGIHETTVSRAIANKYMQTPRGVFEMKYFFTPGFKTADGQQISNKTIKDSIAKLVDSENSAKPYSDQAIVEKLKETGLKVARRTIAKYREELRIPPSHMRKII